MNETMPVFLSVDWSHITAANILFAAVSFFTFATSLLNFIQGRSNSRKLNDAKTVAVETKAVTDTVATNVNGHLAAINSNLEATKRENETLKLLLTTQTAANAVTIAGAIKAAPTVPAE